MNIVLGIIATLVANTIQAAGMVTVQYRMQRGVGGKGAPPRPMTDVLRDPLWYVGYAAMLSAILLNILAFSFVPASVIAALGGTTVMFTLCIAHAFTAFKARAVDVVLVTVVMAATVGALVIMDRFPPIAVTPETAQHPSVLIAGGLFMTAVIVAASHRSLMTYTIVLGSFGGTVALLMTFINLDHTNVQRMAWSVPTTVVFLVCEALIFNYVCRFYAIQTVTVLYYAVYVIVVTMGSIVMFMDITSHPGDLAGLVACICVTCVAVVLQGLRIHAKVQ